MIVNENFFDGLNYNGRSTTKVVMISGGFDPLHIGHLKYIMEASHLKFPDGILVAVVNGDGFLKRKKTYNFMNEIERASIVDNIKGVDYTLVWDDGTQFVHGAIELIKPDVFAKGGDRKSDSTMPIEEVQVCEKYQVELIYGVGGFDKKNSSSELVDNMKKMQENQ